MSLSEIARLFNEKVPFDEALSCGHVSGLWGSLRAVFIASAALRIKNNIFVACATSDDAMRLDEALSVFLGQEMPLSYFLDNEDVSLRVPLIDLVSQNKTKCIVTGSYSSFSKKTFASSSITSKRTAIKNGMPLNRDKLISVLASSGYSRVYSVEAEGEFSVRGGIVDIYSPGRGPVRLELDNEKIASLRQFDPLTQRSTSVSDEAWILPFMEEGDSDFFALDKKASVLIAGSPDDVPKGFASGRQKLFLTRFPPAGSNAYGLDSSMPEDFGGDAEKFLRSLYGKNSSVFIISKQSARLKELMADFPSGARVEHGELHEGFVLRSAGIELYTDKEIFGEQMPRRRYKPVEMPSGAIADPGFKEGDLVVHRHYGIGIYRGIQRQCASGIYSDYLFIQYDSGDCLYVPVNKMRLLSKYSAPSEQPPRLSRLGTGEWSRLKKKVKKSVKDMTKELVKIYSSRREVTGFAFPEDSLWQKEFEDAFPYEETRDQHTAVLEVKKDMGADRPMDRLLCGDVGFGKTEVAMRAAFKSVDSGKQVCMLVPTTILAEQHYLLFKERFSPFPFRVEMLSRFRDKIQQKEIAEKTRQGAVDVLIGTHRLLQKDISFKELGLLIIDEEQRFGVAHKEKIKKYKNHVDVLSMSATPIPRTLYMALSGIWDMSVIETPPPGRSRIQTHVGPWSKKTVREAVEKEIERGGQVFYVHNRVESIAASVKRLRDICPGIRIAGAHGRMDERTLEKIMMDFSSGNYDVLVCTTIIESGLDMPNVNTIIIEDPQKMGLSTLYQLRGRVGRSDVKAFAYLLYEPGGSFTEKSMDRLTAIKSYTELGSGQKIAMKDLEIRGAGNVLGAQQHGHVLAVGFDLYCEILKEASLEAKGERPQREREPEIDLKIDAFLPSSYVEDEGERASLYKRMNSVAAQEDRQKLYEEINDRFGRLPQEADNLFHILDLKLAAKEKGVGRIRKKADLVSVEKASVRAYLRVAGSTGKDLVEKIKKSL
jgi:transcription-repair coupling factor (superfamily II helicase)